MPVEVKGIGGVLFKGLSWSKCVRCTHGSDADIRRPCGTRKSYYKLSNIYFESYKGQSIDDVRKCEKGELFGISVDTCDYYGHAKYLTTSASLIISYRLPSLTQFLQLDPSVEYSS